jgi:hypothetical protein
VSARRADARERGARGRAAHSSATLDPWHASLEMAGFTRLAAGRRYRASAGVLTLTDGWGMLTASRRTPRPHPLGGPLGAPGLWRLAGDEDSCVQRVFEIPPGIFADPGGAGANGSADDALVEFLRWAVATANGELPAGWVPPARTQIDEWLRDVGLTVRAGSSLRQGVIVHEPDRLALCFPLSPTPCANLGPARRAWLRELLVDAQSRWRLVRIGETTTGAFQAEVDLSGAPASLTEKLVRIGLDTLRWVVGWLIRSLDFLADPTAACRALEVLPRRV